MKYNKGDIEEYVEPIFRYCLKRLSDRREAEDLAQEILVNVLKGIEKYEIKNLQAWVWRIAHNRYARFIDQKNNGLEICYGQDYIFNTAAPNDPVNEKTIREEEKQAVFKSLHSLSQMYRKIMVDYYVQENSVKEIAKKYDLPPTTVKWRLHSGREKVKERMGKMKSEKKIHDRINWNTTLGHGTVDTNKYLGTQLARAICLAAYEKPLTVEEISIKTGLPAMYIEDELPRLIQGEAVIRKGKKYLTNFIILQREDNKKMIAELKSYIPDITDKLNVYFKEKSKDIAEVGFYGSNFSKKKLGHILVPLILRRVIKEIQEDNKKLQFGPYPPRRDGSFGWFVVQETEGQEEKLPEIYSGCNFVIAPERLERGIFKYLWVTKHFENELYQCLKWMYYEDIMAKIKEGKIDTKMFAEEELAKLLKYNLIQKNKNSYSLSFPVFTRKQYKKLKKVMAGLVSEVRGILREPVFKIWEEFHNFVPQHVQGQINQYLSGYTHNIIGLSVLRMVEKGQLASPPVQGPLTYNILYLEEVLTEELPEVDK